MLASPNQFNFGRRADAGSLQISSPTAYMKKYNTSFVGPVGSMLGSPVNGAMTSEEALNMNVMYPGSPMSLKQMQT